MRSHRIVCAVVIILSFCLPLRGETTPLNFVKIAGSDDPVFAFAALTGSALNNRGEVAFYGVGGVEYILKGDGGPLTIITYATPSNLAIAPFKSVSPPPSINNNGLVAFYGTRAAAAIMDDSGIYVGDGSDLNGTRVHYAKFAASPRHGHP